jgi:hypothetical protein
MVDQERDDQCAVGGLSRRGGARLEAEWEKYWLRVLPAPCSWACVESQIHIKLTGARFHLLTSVYQPLMASLRWLSVHARYEVLALTCWYFSLPII